jgi:hypothetical protein
LGHILTPSGIKPNPETEITIVTYGLPFTVKQLRLILAIANYLRKFLPYLINEALILYKKIENREKGPIT